MYGFKHHTVQYLLLVCVCEDQVMFGVGLPAAEQVTMAVPSSSTSTLSLAVTSSGPSMDMPGQIRLVWL